MPSLHSECGGECSFVSQLRLVAASCRIGPCSPIYTGSTRHWDQKEERRRRIFHSLVPHSVVCKGEGHLTEWSGLEAESSIDLSILPGWDNEYSSKRLRLEIVNDSESETNNPALDIITLQGRTDEKLLAPAPFSMALLDPKLRNETPR